MNSAQIALIILVAVGFTVILRLLFKLEYTRQEVDVLLKRLPPDKEQASIRALEACRDRLLLSKEHPTDGAGFNAIEIRLATEALKSAERNSQ